MSVVVMAMKAGCIKKTTIGVTVVMELRESQAVCVFRRAVVWVVY